MLPKIFTPVDNDIGGPIIPCRMQRSGGSASSVDRDPVLPNRCASDEDPAEPNSCACHGDSANPNRCTSNEDFTIPNTCPSNRDPADTNTTRIDHQR